MFYGNGNSSSLKYFKKLNVYKNSTGSNYFDPETMVATSYNWWVYLKRIKGKLVFNDYSYSPSTSGHQSALKGVLKDLGIKIDIIVFCRQGLTDSGINEAIEDKFKSIVELEILIARKGSKKETNEFRKKQIKKLNNDIETLQSIGGKLSKAKKAEIKKEAIENEKNRVIAKKPKTMSLKKQQAETNFSIVF